LGTQNPLYARNLNKKNKKKPAQVLKSLNPKNSKKLGVLHNLLPLKNIFLKKTHSTEA
jgi:hypothetical protein